MRGTIRWVLLLFLLQNAILSGQDDLFDWNQTPDLFPGIKHAFLETKQPRPLKINVIRIDLTRKDLRFMTVKRDPDWGKPMPDYPSLPIRTRRLTVKKFMQNALDRGIDMLVAVNASPWSPWKPPYTHSYAAKLGLVISDGEIVDEVNGRPVFLITKKGDFQIRKVGKNEDTSDIQLALPGFTIILENGKVVNGKKLAPRTAYGLTAQNRYMLIMTIDGRMKGISEGVSIKELGEWMRKFGAEKAINMDGGGSTTLVVSDGKGGIRRLNAGIFYRTVASSLGIYRIKTPDNNPVPQPPEYRENNRSAEK